MGKPKVVEVQGVGFRNKGAELMLACITDKLNQRYGRNVRVVIRPNQTNEDSTENIRKLGVSILTELYFKGISIGFWIDLLPRKLVRALGLYTRSDVDIVLDSSGLKYSDAWGYNEIKHARQTLSVQHRRKKPIIFLPQAFGPLEVPRNKALMKCILRFPTHIYARDSHSYECVKSLGKGKRVKRCVDITINYNPQVEIDVDLSDKVLIIPNKRMLDKGDKESQLKYTQYMRSLIQRLTTDRHEVAILNHEGEEDLELCKTLLKNTPECSLVDGEDAKSIKKIIGTSKLCISSRYHGAVSALSQKVPCFVTSWNHKYEMLLEDFSVPEHCLQMDLNQDYSKISSLLQDHSNFEKCVDKLSTQIKEMEPELSDMWNHIFQIIDQKEK